MLRRTSHYACQLPLKPKSWLNCHGLNSPALPKVIFLYSKQGTRAPYLNTGALVCSMNNTGGRRKMSLKCRKRWYGLVEEVFSYFYVTRYVDALKKHLRFSSGKPHVVPFLFLLLCVSQLDHRVPTPTSTRCKGVESRNHLNEEITPTG